MTTRQIAAVLFGIAAVLFLVSALIEPPARPRLFAVAVAFTAAGLAVQVLA
jgi:low temperature requirement protein LtrA